jgi:hypothetical protein
MAVNIPITVFSDMTKCGVADGTKVSECTLNL